MTKTTCPYCGVGCGVFANVTGPRTAEIAGDPDHPANRAKLCSKGTHLGETVGLEGRLLHPMLHGQRATWDAALDAVAQGFADTIAQHGPDSVAFYVSGQLLTEDYYVANKLMKGFIGSANIDTNSRLCMSSAVAAHIRAFGEDVVPCSYDDLDQADLIVLVGSNTAWCHPIIWQRIEAARAARGTKLVVIDPRRTETAAGADLHLAVRPDGDVALFNGLLVEMRARGVLDEAYLAAHVDVPVGFWDDLTPLPLAGGVGGGPCLTERESRDCTAHPNPSRKREGLLEWSQSTGIPPDQLTALADLVAAHPRTLTLFSQGANQSVIGTDKGNAIINLHLATGRIGKPGAGPFSITGQPNAMGGREVGGLASTLAAHMDFSPENCDRVQRFWNSPTIATVPGLKAVDLFRAVDDGRVKAIWIMATNPAMSMPDAGFVRAALAKCPLVVVSDVVADTDTGAFAHIHLPALAWGEKDGTVTNSERMISRQRALFAPPGEARADWDIIADVARRMGFRAGFGYCNAASIFREYAAQTGFENDGARKLDISDLLRLPREGGGRCELGAIPLKAASGGLRAPFAGATGDEAYDLMQPTRWGGQSPFADGRFSTPNRRARMIAPAPSVATQSDPDYPLRLNTARYRDQWHSMTRTGFSPRLSQHRREPSLEICAENAAQFKLADGGLAWVRTTQGSSIFRVCITPDQRPGEICVPMHWTDQTSSGGRSNLLPNQNADPFSGQPGFKNSAASVAPFVSDWSAFLVCADLPQLPGSIYWTKIRQAGGWLIELAGAGAVDVDALLPPGERIESFDAARGTRRIAVRDAQGRLAAALFLTRSGQLPPRDWIVSQLGGVADSAALLAGRPAQLPPDRGPIVCVCFDVGMKAILSAIIDQSLATVECVGAALSAGTNCGSCRPAIRDLIKQQETVDA